MVVRRRTAQRGNSGKPARALNARFLQCFAALYQYLVYSYYIVLSVRSKKSTIRVILYYVRCHMDFIVSLYIKGGYLKNVRITTNERKAMAMKE